MGRQDPAAMDPHGTSSRTAGKGRRPAVWSLLS